MNNKFDRAPVKHTDKEVRSKLISWGVGFMSDAELLSILLHDRSQGRPGLEYAERFLNHFEGNLKTMTQMEIEDLSSVLHLGVHSAARLVAAIELGRRVAQMENNQPETISNNDDVMRIFQTQIGSLKHEEFWVLYLTSANTVAKKCKISQGGVTGTAVDHKIIVKRAVELLVPSMILVHNHPSGVPLPSREDEILTEKIAQAASLFDIMVLDHIIVTAGDNFSFRKAGLLI